MVLILQQQVEKLLKNKSIQDQVYNDAQERFKATLTELRIKKQEAEIFLNKKIDKMKEENQQQILIIQRLKSKNNAAEVKLDMAIQEKGILFLYN